MRRLVIAVLFIFAFSVRGVSASDYILGAGDVVGIHIFGVSDLNIPELAIRNDGKVGMPLVGDVELAGLTPTAAADKVKGLLAYYYENPLVTVNVINFRTTRVYVLGQVNRAGSYELDREHNLMDAIGAAQGWTKDALKTKVYIVRKDKPQKPELVNLLDLLKRGDTSKNYILNDGDIVFLTDNHKVNIIEDVISLVYPAWLLHNWTQVKNNNGI